MICLLPVTWDDSADLLRWRNDPVTRANSRNTAEVSPDDHQAWMRVCMSPSHPKGKVWIADVDGTSVGMVRIAADCEVSINVAPEHRGKGYSKTMLKQALDQMKVPYLFAEIKQTNAASRHIFEQCGFEMADESDGILRYRIDLSCDTYSRVSRSGTS